MGRGLFFSVPFRRWRHSCGGEAALAWGFSGVRADLQSARMDIGIYNPAILFIASQMLIFNAVGFQIRQNVTESPLLLSQTRHALIPEEPSAYFGRA